MVLKLKFFHKRRERKVGADWEWYIDLPECRIGYRVQAKKLYENLKKPGEYPKLTFKPGLQTDILIRMAYKKNPIFVFYNHDYVKDSRSFFYNRFHNRYGYIRPSYWGCTFASARNVRDIKQKRLSDLSPVMHPLFRLVDCPNIDPKNGNIKFESGIHLDDKDQEIVDMLRESRFENVDFSSGFVLSTTNAFERT